MTRGLRDTGLPERYSGAPLSGALEVSSLDLIALTCPLPGSGLASRTNTWVPAVQQRWGLLDKNCWH